jgi:hypothetical protein
MRGEVIGIHLAARRDRLPERPEPVAAARAEASTALARGRRS